MSEPPSGAQLTRLGERIRSGKEEPGDDVLLADYLLSFHEFSEDTIQDIVAILSAAQLLRLHDVRISERTVKSSQSIKEKLKREPSLRLDQMRDIVGCRIVVPIAKQAEIVKALLDSSEGSELIDRRSQPNHGYRAIHVIIRRGRLRYEVQVRTAPQHAWATLVERMIRSYGIDIKYGGGPEVVQAALQDLSRLIGLHEWEPTAETAHEIERRLDELNEMLGE